MLSLSPKEPMVSQQDELVRNMVELIFSDTVLLEGCPYDAEPLNGLMPASAWEMATGAPVTTGRRGSGVVMVQFDRADVVLALAPRLNAELNVMLAETGSMTERPRQLDHARMLFYRMVIMLAKYEQVARRLEREVSDVVTDDLKTTAASLLQSVTDNLPADVLQLAMLAGASGRYERLRRTKPEVVAALHDFMVRKGLEGQLALAFLQRVANEVAGESFAPLRWTEQHMAACHEMLSARKEKC